MTIDLETARTPDEVEFRYWSRRSAQEAARAINGASRACRLAHQRLAVLCMREALLYVPSATGPDDRT